MSGPLSAGQTSTLGTIPAGYRPTENREFVGHVVSSGALVVGLITAATGVVTLTFWRAGLDSGRFVNLQALSWPTSY
ncbi:hypothetical protein GCM10029963_53120 [Micromonospora andamanensis]